MNYTISEQQVCTFANCADVVVMSVPSHGFRGVLAELGKELRPWVPVVSLVKGLDAHPKRWQRHMHQCVGS